RAGATGARRLLGTAFELAGGVSGRARRSLESTFGGPARTRVIILLALVLALSSADTSTVGASATELRQALHIGNTDIGLLVSVTGAVGALASVPFGVLVDRFNRINLLVASMLLWGLTMLGSATVNTFGALMLVRAFLGAVTAIAGPAVASLIGDYFPSAERGKIYGYVLGGELIGAGIGFFITGDVAAISWRAAFVLLAIPVFALAWQLRKLPEPARGGASWLMPGSTSFVGRQQARRESDTTIAQPAPAPEGLGTSEAQKTAQQRGIKPDPTLILRTDPREMNILAATRYVLRVRTNVILILSSACAYFFLTGIQTFGLEFVGDQYGVHTIVANLLMLVVGAGAVGGVLVGGRLGDSLIRRGYISGRVLIAGVAALATVVLFIPPLLTKSPFTALPYVTAAAFCLTAQNPPLDAARLDIMVPLLWGRAEGIRTFLRTAAQSVAPVAFGGLSDLLGNNHSSLHITFLIMLLPLAGSGVILLRGLRYYPTDVATAAASLVAYENKAPPPPDSPEQPPGGHLLE
ncbi:MAG TPA: MFS transporter, partial [Acidimicrobiales bacterium]|nr:MFS transporter [Acidimicrobiales bacterium]